MSSTIYVLDSLMKRSTITYAKNARRWSVWIRSNQGQVLLGRSDKLHLAILESEYEIMATLLKMFHWTPPVGPNEHRLRNLIKEVSETFIPAPQTPSP